jgi:hypothetical protein
MAVGFGWPATGLVAIYYAAGAVVFAVVFFGRLWRMPRANQLLAVTVFMVMLPPVSYFYALVHLYAAWVVLMFLAVKARNPVRGLGAAILLFVPLFGSFTLLTFRGVWLFGGLVQACLLGAMFVCAVWFPFESCYAGRMIEPLSNSLATVPVEDEDITPETAAALERGRALLAWHEGVAHEEMLKEFES